MTLVVKMIWREPKDPDPRLILLPNMYPNIFINTICILNAKEPHFIAQIDFNDLDFNTRPAELMVKISKCLITENYRY